MNLLLTNSFSSGDMNIHLYSLTLVCIEMVELLFLTEGEEQFPLHGQFHLCWYLGDARSQGIDRFPLTTRLQQRKGLLKAKHIKWNSLMAASIKIKHYLWDWMHSLYNGGSTAIKVINRVPVWYMWDDIRGGNVVVKAHADVPDFFGH